MWVNRIDPAMPVTRPLYPQLLSNWCVQRNDAMRHKRTLGCSSVELVDHVVAVDWDRCGVGEANRLGPF